MAKSEKKAKKAAKAAKAGKSANPKKIKIPKEVGGFKIPKELRQEGEKLIEALKGALSAQATAAAFNAISRVKFDIDPTRRRPH